MLKALYRDGKACPIITCDICGDMIGDIKDGVAIMQGPPKENAKVPVLHAHRGNCQLKAHDQSAQSAEQELAAHFIIALVNSCMDMPTFNELFRRMESSGDLEAP